MSGDEYAIVPFSYASPYADHLRAEERLIRIGEIEYTLKQAWKDDSKGGTELGFGASVYGSAIVLADYVVKHGLNPSSKTRVNVLEGRSLDKKTIVIELGAGLGLVSLACEQAGAAHVFATDGDDGVLVQLQENLTLNHSSCTTVHKLFWGSDSDERVLQDAVNSFTAGKTDCNVVLLGADIVAVPYAPALRGLAATIKHIMSPGFFADAVCTTFLLAYQRRHHEEDDFFRLLHEFLSVSEIPTHDIHPDFHNRFPPIQVMEFKAL